MTSIRAVCSISLLLVIASTNANLYDPGENLSYFDLLTPRSISIRVKRDALGNVKHKSLSLFIFGRRVSLILQPGLSKLAFSPQAELHAVHSNGTRVRFFVDHNDFHQGFMHGRRHSKVNSFQHKGLWMIHVAHQSMSFSVEPLAFYTGSNQERRMLVFKHRDITPWGQTGEPGPSQQFAHETNQIYKKMKTQKHTNPRMDTSDQVRKHLSQSYSNVTKLKTRPFWQRLKRALKSETADKRDYLKTGKKLPLEFCDILSVADFTFFSGIGGKSTHRTAKILILAYSVANGIFQSTDFRMGKTVGISLRAMDVLTTDKSREYTDKEMLNDPQATNVQGQQILDDIALIPFFKDYCLTHLSTERQLQENVIGLAATVSNKNNGHGGICGHSMEISSNVGLSTVMFNSLRLQFASYCRVLTHEIAHGFGARHDTEYKECDKVHPVGGGYMMSPTITDGKHPNNYKFSKCSIDNMRKMIQDRKNCLVPENILMNSQCGNGVLDYGEDCDTGSYVDDPDGCCTRKCRFTPQAICSPFNHPCCKDCNVAPKGHVCVNEPIQECAEPSTCNGDEYDVCPLPRAKPTGSVCSNHGQCHNGECVNYCTILGNEQSPVKPLLPCRCGGDRRAMCSVCCRLAVTVNGSANNDSSCTATDKDLDDNTHCANGLCQKGSCKEVVLKDMFSFNAMTNKSSQELISAASFTSIHFLVSLGIMIQNLLL